MRSTETDNFSSGEEISPDEANVASLLGGLTRVSAPNDFSFRVKARIAAGRPMAAAGPRFRRLKIFAPATLAVAVAAFAGFTYLGGTATDEPALAGIAPVPATVSTPIQAPAAAPTPAPAENVREVATAKPSPVTGTREISDRPALPKRNTEEEGGSRTITLRAPSRVIMPRGFDLPSSTELPANSNTAAQTRTSVREVLSMLGIDASLANRGWLVNSTAGNSTGERSGVKKGDIVEAIDDRDIGTEKEIAGRVTFHSLRVIRDGRPVIIILKNH